MEPETTARTGSKGGKTRQRILETASALMAEKGPDAVSMREISARLKITKPVLYYYFKDKDGLIKASFSLTAFISTAYPPGRLLLRPD